MPKRTPLYDWHVAHGARMVDFAGWDMPVQYTNIIDEHQAVRTVAGLFDISHMGRLTFSGPGALNLIQKLYTNDAATMKPGQVRYGLVCNEQGGILDDVLVYRLASFWLMVVNASNREKIVRWIGEHQGSESVAVQDRTFEWGMVAVQGPQALDIAASCRNAALRDFLDRMKNLKYYYAVFADPLIVSRTGYTGEDGFEFIVPSASLNTFCQELTDAAGRAGVPLTPCGLGARDTLRLEAAMPLYGHELNEDIDPYQAGLEWAVKMDKGSFLGREALARRRLDKGRRQRVGLELEGKRIAREGSAVLNDGRSVGLVSSGTFAPTLGKAIAMAYIDPAHSAVGTACEVDVRGKPAPAHVVSLPFYDRKRKT
jgi:aminomethyltransferase